VRQQSHCGFGSGDSENAIGNVHTEGASGGLFEFPQLLNFRKPRSRLHARTRRRIWIGIDRSGQIDPRLRCVRAQRARYLHAHRAEQRGQSQLRRSLVVRRAAGVDAVTQRSVARRGSIALAERVLGVAVNPECLQCSIGRTQVDQHRHGAEQIGERQPLTVEAEGARGAQPGMPGRTTHDDRSSNAKRHLCDRLAKESDRHRSSLGNSRSLGAPRPMNGRLASSRSPGLRLSAGAPFPSPAAQWLFGAAYTAYSCRGSPGITPGSRFNPMWWELDVRKECWRRDPGSSNEFAWPCSKKFMAGRAVGRGSLPRPKPWQSW
jgi:hypothetical protein